MCSKPKVKMQNNHGTWTVSTEFYGVQMYSMSDNVIHALAGLKSDMEYVERELVMRVGVGTLQ